MNTHINNLGIPICIIDVIDNKDFIFRQSNASSTDYFEKNLSNPEGTQLERDEDAIYQRKKILRVLNECTLNRKEVIFESRQTSSTATRHSRHVCTPVLDEEGHICKITIVSSDISELKEIRKKLSDTEAQLNEVNARSLRGLVNICAECKSINVDEKWQSIEEFVYKQTNYREFSHGMCNLCENKLYGKLDDI